MNKLETLFARKQSGITPDANHYKPPEPSSTAFTIAFPPKFNAFADLYRLSYVKDSQSAILVSCTSLRQEALVRDAEKIKIKLIDFAAARLKQLYALQEAGYPPNLDEDIFVYITEDEMLGFFLLVPSIGNGRVLTSSKIIQLLIDHGITYGLDLEFIHSLADRENRYFRFYLAACGTEPVDGTDGYIVELYQQEIYSAIEDTELRHVDFARLNLSKRIQKNGVICEIVPPTSGRSGITVTRNLLLPPPRDGQPAKIPMGRNTCLSENGRYLIAQTAGRVDFVGDSFQVKSVLDVHPGSDPEEEDIKFLGDIHIHGDIGPGVSIRATGSILIDGVVQDCTIEAGENIIVQDGIQGLGNSVVRAHKSVYAGYLERCTIYARESVQANCIVDCRVYSNGTVTARTGPGAIVSGSIHCSGGVSARIIGSKAAVHTKITIGGSPYDMSDRKEIISELEVINESIQQLSEQPETAETKAALSKLRLNQYVVQMKLNKLQKEAQADQFPFNLKDAHPLVCDRIYPGGCIVIGDRSIEIDREKINCTISVNSDGNISLAESR